MRTGRQEWGWVREHPHRSRGSFWGGGGPGNKKETVVVLILVQMEHVTKSY